MDENLGVKAAPVTRLRRRLSVEPEDSPLPTTPSTPTKKRNTRLAAKPQLELIDEVATENVPKKTTRKAAVKEAVEPEGTPTPVTPSRRSTRIRSNTSILSETTTQHAESPRAKRALRRNSQLGSDTESLPVTPARQTRRTRKDSDKPADENVVLNITSSDAKLKTEGQEIGASKDFKANEINDHSPSTRKSPRLNKKGGKADDETDKSNKETNKTLNNSRENTEKLQSDKEIKSNLMESCDQNTSPKVKETEKEKLSTSSTNLINEMKTKNSKINALNKSTSAIEKIANNLTHKRNRTKSWTTITSPSTVGFMSDNEGAKEKIRRSKTPNIAGSGDGLLTNDANKSSSKNELDIKSPNRSINKSKSSLLNSSVENKENIVMSHEKFAEFEMNKSDTVKLFEKSPNNQSPLVVIDDSDSCSVDKFINIQMDGEDQCVPVVTNPTNESPEKREQSVEPMDIDESMPLNVTIDDFSDKSNTSKEDAQIADGKRISSVSEKSPMKDDSINKSKRKSSVSIQSETPQKLSIGGEADKNDTMKKNSSVLDKLNDSIRDKSNRTSSISQGFNDSLDKSQRKSSVSINEENLEKINESFNKSKRKSSISQNISEINQNVNESRKSLDKSQRKSSVSINEENVEKINESSNKSKRKSSVSIGEENIEMLNESSNKSKNKSSVSQINSEINLNVNESRKSSENSLRKSSVSINEENVEKINESSNKSKRKSSVSQSNSDMNRKSISDENNDSKSSNKSKRSSSISQTEQNFEKSGNENKSTLVISQLKDVSSNDTNNVMSPNVTNNELSKSMNGPNVKSKGIDKKNLSLNYLTSTPIQQKPLQKLNMQINTSIISHAVDEKNNTPMKNDMKELDSDSSVETDDEIKFKNESITGQKKKQARALSSSGSDSEGEFDTKPETQSKLSSKKSPNKKAPAPDSSDSSDDESDSKSQNNKKTPNKKLNESKLESKADASNVKTPIKKNPTSESESSDDSDKDSISKKRNDKSKAEAKKATPNKKPAFDSDSSDNSDEESANKSQQINKKTPNKNHNNKSKADVSKVKTTSIKTADSSESSDDLDENVPKNKSKLVDDEASEASDDYESGDSQNEEDRQYEEEHEIAEKGETLDSEEDFSNDSDYEKDSFLVSSDAEDYEILSGTGDDLSMSDNELTMSAKSKKKFNERKLKQQKKASKEMYEARHKKNEYANDSKSDTSKTKKIKRQRLESSTLDSENEDKQPKKNNRARMDSSQDSSLVKSEADESIGLKKKKSKRLSESVCEDTMNEKEITVFNQSTTEKNDPLSVAIKQEPKTPLKQLNMSTVAINEKIEEVQVDSNASIMRQNETLDPLQATLAVDDDDSSSSGNMEIIQNYDSVLNSLGMQTQKIKTIDTSLNMNKKLKHSKDPVFDQLNLTQTKTKKTKTLQDDKPTESVKAKEIYKVDDDSSDSIDMKLLFPEDSNDSEINASQFKPKVNEPADDFIPLKRTEAKTNIHENIDKNVSLNESAFNVSKKKNKKRKSSQSAPDDVTNIPDATEATEDIKIIIDTTGSHELDTSVAQTNSSKKKNKKNKSFTEESTVPENIVEVDCTDGVVETPIETSFMSEKKKKKNKNKSFEVSTNNVESSFIVTEEHSVKKSKKKSESTSDFIETHFENIDNTIVEEMPVNISINSDKKKKKDKNVSQISGLVMEATPSQSAKKKSKKNSICDSVEPQTQNTELEELHANIKSEKKKKKNKQHLDVSQINMDKTGAEGLPAGTSTPNDKKKKNKQHLDVSQSNVDKTEPEELAAETSAQSDKKKKRKKKNKQNLEVSQTVVDNTGEDSDEGPMEMSYKSEKKSDATDAMTDEILTPSSDKKKHKKNKKKKKNKNLSQSSEKSADDVATKQDGDIPKKRKRKASEQSPTATEDANLVIVESNNDKKKRKIHPENEFIPVSNNPEQNDGDGSSKKSKKNKKSKNSQTIEQDEVPSNNSNKKRKHRDEDGAESMSKISKHNSFDKIHVPTLPESVLNQLTDKPQKNISKNKKGKSAIATMPFTVEEAVRRKNKPSNYLEQSVYLNDSPAETKQKRRRNRKPKPKVLPFTPTALTSGSGYTSKFNINLLPADTQFVAQASNVENFRESFLGSQRINKLGTFERCKRQRSHKLAKF